MKIREWLGRFFLGASIDAAYMRGVAAGTTKSPRHVGEGVTLHAPTAMLPVRIWPPTPELSLREVLPELGEDDAPVNVAADTPVEAARRAQGLL